MKQSVWIEEKNLQLWIYIEKCLDIINLKNCLDIVNLIKMDLCWKLLQFDTHGSTLSKGELNTWRKRFCLKNMKIWCFTLTWRAGRGETKATKADPVKTFQYMLHGHMIGHMIGGECKLLKALDSHWIQISPRLLRSSWYASMGVHRPQSIRLNYWFIRQSPNPITFDTLITTDHQYHVPGR